MTEAPPLRLTPEQLRQGVAVRRVESRPATTAPPPPGPPAYDDSLRGRVAEATDRLGRGDTMIGAARLRRVLDELVDRVEALEQR